MRALEVKGAAPVKAKQKSGVTANAPKSQGAPPRGARPPVVPSQVPPLEVTKQPLVTANTEEWQEASSHDAQPPAGVKPKPPATTSPGHFAWLQRFAERMGTEHRTQCRNSAKRNRVKPRGGHSLGNAPAPPYRASRARLARA